MRVYILAATFHQCQVSHSRSYLECQYNWWSTNKEKGKVENMQFTSNVSQSDEKFMRAFPKQQEQRTRKFEEFYWKPPFLTMCIHNSHNCHIIVSTTTIILTSPHRAWLTQTGQQYFPSFALKLCRQGHRHHLYHHGPHGVRRPSIFVEIYQWWKGLQNSKINSYFTP